MVRLLLASVVITLALAALFSSSAVGAVKSYQVSFPFTDHSSYAKIPGSISKPLEAFTLCLWERPSNLSVPMHFMFSYAVDGLPNPYQLIASVGKSLVYLRIDHSDIGVNPPKPPENGVWMHYCFTWTYYGKMEIYENGKRLGEAIGKAVGHRIPANGVTILGQLQNSAGGGFEPGRSWRGDLSEVQLWDHVLCPNQIADLANCRSDSEGNVISYYSSVLSLVTKDGASVRPVRLCEQQDQCQTPLF